MQNVGIVYRVQMAPRKSLSFLGGEFVRGAATAVIVDLGFLMK